LSPIILFLLMLILPAIASLNIKLTYSKYLKKKSNSGKTGYDVAKEILTKNDLSNIYIVETSGELSDCYDPTRKTVRLSKDVYHGTSVASISVAAHECGHAIQDKEGYSWMRLRSSLYPIVSIGEKFSYILFVIAVILDSIDLYYLAVFLLALGLVFQIVTLPVEFNASARAEKLLKEYKITENDDAKGVHKVLKAAALTYVAGTLSTALYIFSLLYRGRD